MVSPVILFRQPHLLEDGFCIPVEDEDSLRRAGRPGARELNVRSDYPRFMPTSPKPVDSSSFGRIPDCSHTNHTGKPFGGDVGRQDTGLLALGTDRDEVNTPDVRGPDSPAWGQRHDKGGSPPGRSDPSAPATRCRSPAVRSEGSCSTVVCGSRSPCGGFRPTRAYRPRSPRRSSFLRDWLFVSRWDSGRDCESGRRAVAYCSDHPRARPGGSGPENRSLPSRSAAGHANYDIGTPDRRPDETGVGFRDGHGKGSRHTQSGRGFHNIGHFGRLRERLECGRRTSRRMQRGSPHR